MLLKVCVILLVFSAGVYHCNGQAAGLAGTVTATSFRRIPLFDGFITDKHFYTEHNLGKLACASACAQNTICVSFFHVRDANRCRMHTIEFSAGRFKSKNFAIQAGAQYYRSSECKQHGYRDFAKTPLAGCYRYDRQQSYDWHKATEICNNNGGRLIVLDNKEKLDFIRQEIKATFSVSSLSEAFWVGARMVSNGSHRFYWLNDSELERNSTLWAPGEPKSTGNACVLLDPILDYMLDDFACDTGLTVRAICEW